MPTAKHNLTKYSSNKVRTKARADTGQPSNYQIRQPTNRRSMKMNSAVTPRQFRTAYNAAQGGDPNMLHEILDYFKKIDDEIPGSLQQLISAVTTERYSITARDDGGEEAQRQADVIERVLEGMDITSMIETLLEYHYYGVRAVAMPGSAWSMETIDGRTYQVPTTWESVPRGWIYAKKEEAVDDYTTIHVGDEPYYRYPLGAVILATSDKLPSWEDVDFTRLGKGTTCIRFATFKYYNYEDWAAFNEVFATPTIIGRVGEGGHENVVRQAVMNLANDARAIIGRNDSIEFPESNKTSSIEAYDRFVDVINKAIAKIVKSESLTDNMGDTGSYAAMKTTNGIKVDVAKRMAGNIKRLIVRRVLQPIVDLNWNGRWLIDFGIPVQGAENVRDQIHVDSQLARMMEGSKAHLRRKYNYPAPTDEDDIVRKSSGGPLV